MLLLVVPVAETPAGAPDVVLVGVMMVPLVTEALLAEPLVAVEPEGSPEAAPIEVALPAAALPVLLTTPEDVAVADVGTVVLTLPLVTELLLTAAAVAAVEPEGNPEAAPIEFALPAATLPVSSMMPEGAPISGVGVVVLTLPLVMEPLLAAAPAAVEPEGSPEAAPIEVALPAAALPDTLPLTPVAAPWASTGAVSAARTIRPAAMDEVILNMVLLHLHQRQAMLVSIE